MKLKVLDCKFGGEKHSIFTPGTNVSLSNNGSNIRVCSLNPTIMNELFNPEISFSMDDKKTQITITGFLRVPGSELWKYFYLECE
jgi:hypothetical protein